MTSTGPLPTFRDPAGSLAFQDGHALRTIHPAHREAMLAFLNSPFCHRLQARGDLIACTIEDSPLRLIHPRIPVPTYPWEWVPSQWQAAADLTLSLCQEALHEGWILKDATPLNILFVGARPMLVDILSFQPYRGNSFVWPAYGQYIRTFLLPLVMHRLLHWPLAGTIFRRDGYEPAELYPALTWPQRLSRAAFWPITLPVLFERAASPDELAPSQTTAPSHSAAIKRLHGNLSDLRRRTASAMSPRHTTSWSQYSDTMTHYTPAQRADKIDWLTGVFDNLRPQRTLDLGANTGEYSMVAARNGAAVVALERDPVCAENLFLRTRQHAPSILTLHADIARPTPPVGWDNRESSALLRRLEHQFDAVMMLALIHHLLLLDQIPLPAIIDLCGRLTRRHLILEWVPATDPMYRSLIRGRDDLYASLSETDLLNSTKPCFHVQKRHTLGNGRVLFLFEKLA